MKGTIKSKEDVERLFQMGRRSSSSLLTVLALKHEGENPGRCAFIAGKKLGSAPLRSRCKRVMRETSRELGAPWSGYDVAFIARKRIATEEHSRVVGQMRDCLAKLGIA